MKMKHKNETKTRTEARSPPKKAAAYHTQKTRISCVQNLQRRTSVGNAHAAPSGRSFGLVGSRPARRRRFEETCHENALVEEAGSEQAQPGETEGGDRRAGLGLFEGQGAAAGGNAVRQTRLVGCGGAETSIRRRYPKQ